MGDGGTCVRCKLTAAYHGILAVSAYMAVCVAWACKDFSITDSCGYLYVFSVLLIVFVARRPECSNVLIFAYNYCCYYIGFCLLA